MLELMKVMWWRWVCNKYITRPSNLSAQRKRGNVFRALKVDNTYDHIKQDFYFSSVRNYVELDNDLQVILLD